MCVFERHALHNLLHLGTTFFTHSLCVHVPNTTPQDYAGFESTDGSGRKAVGTQEELLLWLNHDDKGRVWKAQYDARQALKGHMKVARETPTFIYGNSQDMTGFIDGTGNPEEERVSLIVVVCLGCVCISF